MVIVSLDSPYMVSCKCLIVTYGLTAPLGDKYFQNLSDLDIEFSRSLRSNVITSFNGISIQ